MTQEASQLGQDPSLQRALTDHQTGRIAEAIEAYRHVLGLEPNHPVANHNLGLLLAQHGKATDALPYLATAVHRVPKDERFWIVYIVALIEANRHESARQAYAEAQKHGVKSEAIAGIGQQLGLNRTNIERLATGSPSRQEMAHAIGLLDGGRISELDQYLNRLFDRYPNHPFAWQVSASAKLKSGMLEKSLVPLRRVTELMPENPDAHNDLGYALLQLGRIDDSIKCLQRALDISQYHFGALMNIGNAYQTLERVDDAERSYRKALKHQSNHPAHILVRNNLGNLLSDLGRLDEAATVFGHVLSIDSKNIAAMSGVGIIYRKKSRFIEAKEVLQGAVALAPNDAYVSLELGRVLIELANYDEAERFLRNSLRVLPELSAARFNLGLVLSRKRKFAEAEREFRLLIERDPENLSVQLQLGSLLLDWDRGTEAESLFRAVIAREPENSAAHNNLGTLLMAGTRFMEADAHFRKAHELEPNLSLAMDNRLFGLNYDPDQTENTIRAAYNEYDLAFGVPQKKYWTQSTVSKTTGRRLKVAYFSPDFCKHSTRHFVEPLLSNHDKDAFEIFLYAEQRTVDDSFTARYRTYADHWINTKGMSDTEVAERVRRDGIDIMVDLAGHTRGHRLGAFALKPAPVSVTWLGYGYTTGLSAIDYILTDSQCAPIGSENLFSEVPWRLDPSCFAYRPAEGMGTASDLPALVNGTIRFCTLSRAIRLNLRVVRVWSRILQRLPTATLVIDSRNFRDPGLTGFIQKAFAENGVRPEQIEIGYHSPPWDVLRSTDIVLDCFPHNSGTTLFESLYMGVPFVTLSDRPSVGRLGASILNALGHSEWIARTEDEYVEKAVELAEDWKRLAELRAGLRGEMEQSPVMDEVGFTRNVETAFREMWINWCRAVV